MVFARVPEPKTVKNRLHWDVHGELDELLDAGARLLRARGEDIDWHVLADPEGNEFCLFAPPDARVRLRSRSGPALHAGSSRCTPEVSGVQREDPTQRPKLTGEGEVGYPGGGLGVSIRSTDVQTSPWSAARHDDDHGGRPVRCARDRHRAPGGGRARRRPDPQARLGAERRPDRHHRSGGARRADRRTALQPRRQRVAAARLQHQDRHRGGGAGGAGRGLPVPHPGDPARPGGGRRAAGSAVPQGLRRSHPAAGRPGPARRAGPRLRDHQGDRQADRRRELLRLRALQPRLVHRVRRRRTTPPRSPV